MDLMQIVRWLQRCRLSKFRKKVIEVSLAAVIYGIWQARNRQLWENERIRIEAVFDNICYIVKTRVIQADCKKMTKVDREWFDKL